MFVGFANCFADSVKGMGSNMVESKYTRVRVNNEIELCEIYEREVKDKIEKAFVKCGVSFFVKWKRDRNAQGETGKYIICVNQFQKQRAEAAIHEILEDANDNVTFVDKRTEKGWLKKFIRNYSNPLAILSKM